LLLGMILSNVIRIIPINGKRMDSQWLEINGSG